MRRGICIAYGQRSESKVHVLTSSVPCCGHTLLEPGSLGFVVAGILCIFSLANKKTDKSMLFK